MKFSIFTLVFGIILFVIIGIFLYNSRKNGILKSIVKTCVLIFSAIISCLSTPKLTYIFLDLIYDKVLYGLPEEFFELLASMGEVGKASFALIIAPIIFVIIFVLIYIVLSIIVKSILNITGNKKISGKKTILFTRLIAIINGIFFFSLIMLPVSSYAETSSLLVENIGLSVSSCDSIVENKEIRAGNFYSGNINGFLIKIQDEILIPIDKDIVGGSLYKLSGRNIMKFLTAYEIENDKTSISQEWGGITETVGDVIWVFGDGHTDYLSEEKREFAERLIADDKTVAVRKVMADTLIYASEKWTSNQPFMKINPPSNSEYFISLEILKNTSFETVCLDINKFFTSALN